MRKFVEDTDSIAAQDVGKALSAHVESGTVELEIAGLVVQKIDIVSTPCRYGGFQRWFLCPGCGGRVGKLYLPTGRCAFLCRRCYRLGYKTQYLRAYKRKRPCDLMETSRDSGVVANG